MEKTTTKKTQTKGEKYLATAMKNLRLSLSEMTMEKFVMNNLQVLMNLEREEYLEKAIEDKGNGYYSRSLRSLMKNGLVINVPRTRNGGFAPLAIELMNMSQDQVNELCLTLYKKGMTTRDVSDVMENFFGNSMSHTTINNLAEQFHTLRVAWHNSPLDMEYAVLYCDAIWITVRRGNSYEKEAVYICYGVNGENKRELLGLTINPSESTTIWKELFLDIQSRGVRQVQLVVSDGILGMEDAVKEVFPSAEFQKCVVHKERNILNTIRPKEKQAVATDLKHVFDNFNATATVEHAIEKCEQFIEKWKDKYPNIEKFFKIGSIEYNFTYIKFPPEIRRLIYTTNSIENLNRGIRKATKNKLSFESPKTLLDYIFIVIKEFEEKNWSKYPVYQFSFIHREETHFI